MEKVNSLEIRTLDPIEDEPLIAEALLWAKDSPRWFQDADNVWGGSDNLKGYIDGLQHQPNVDLGIFEGNELIAVITVTLAARQVFNTHLMARPKANAESIIMAAKSVKNDLFQQGAKEIWAWPAARNYGLRRALKLIGLIEDGVSMIRGESHGLPIEWLRYSAHEG